MRDRVDGRRSKKRITQRRGSVNRLARLLLATALTGAAILATLPAGLANPKGGQVTAGSATISNSSPIQLDIVQSTNRAAIDWQSFDIAVGERTRFQQPSTAAMTLNRVHAADPSTIAGHLSANGSLVLINPNGVVFSKGSQVDVNSIIATPSDITNANFMAGNMRFDRPSPNPNASIVNAGTITVAQKGLAALVAPSVVNSGVIQARLGKVILAGAETFTLDFYGDGLISFDVGPKVTSVPLGADGKPVTSLVSNTGTIDAPGGTVLLTADAVAGILENVIDSSGQINAQTTPQGAGTVTIDAGTGNGARLAGTIDVSSPDPGQTGGTAAVTGGSVNLASTAQVKARGPAGGGTVKIGGGPHGTDANVRNALNTTVAAGALIDASATDNGNGGTVAVWSDGSTVFNGTIYAKGGPNGGDGGWVETSGLTNLYVGSTARVSTLATAGKTGTWLLDPADITITTSATANGSFDGGSPTDTFTAASGKNTANLLNTELQTALATNNVVISTTNCGACSSPLLGTITVSAPVTWSSGNTLTLSADNNIAINAAITGTGGTGVLVLTAGNTTTTGSVTITSAVSVNQFAAIAGSTGTINLNLAGTVVTTAGGGQSYNSPVNLQAATTLTDTANGTIAFTSTIDGANALTVNAGTSTGTVTFTGAVGMGTALSSLTVTGATITLSNNVLTTGLQSYTDTTLNLNGATYETNATPPVGTTATFSQSGATKLGAATVTVDTTGAGGSAAGANITFSSAGTIDNADALVLTAGTGGTIALGAIGATPLTSVNATGKTITLNGSVTTTGTQTYTGAVVLGATDTLTTTNSLVDFTSTVDATAAAVQGLTVAAGTGAVTFGGAVGTTALASLTATGSSITLGGNVTTSGGQTYTGAVVLGATAILTTTNAAVDFTSTVDATTAGVQGLTVAAGSGAVSFGGAVGTTALASLAVTGSSITLNGNVTTVGAQTYTGAVTLDATATLTTSNAAVDFTSTVDPLFFGGQGLTVAAGSGAVSFGGAVGGGSNPLASLTVTGSPITLGGDVTTLNGQTYTGAVILGNTVALATNNAAVDFTSTVDATAAGVQGLTVSAGTGAVTFGGAVGTTALASLEVTGPTVLDGNVTTSGTQTYISAVTLGNTVTVKTTDAAVEFFSTVDATAAGVQGLTVSAGNGTVDFCFAVGGTTALASLTATGATITLDGSVTTTELQSYTDTTLNLNGATYETNASATNLSTSTFSQIGATRLGAATVTVDTTGAGTSAAGANISFTAAGTIDNADALVLTAGTGGTIALGAVGSTLPLASMTATGLTITLNGNVKTTGCRAIPTRR